MWVKTKYGAYVYVDFPEEAREVLKRLQRKSGEMEINVMFARRTLILHLNELIFDEDTLAMGA